MRWALLALALVACGPGSSPPLSTSEAPDADGDGIPDASDLCPESPETFNGYKDDDGCPDDSTAHDPFPPDLATSWTGTMTLTIGARVLTAPQTRTITMASDGMSATLHGVCPDGSGALEVVWLHEQAAWTGLERCPVVAVGGCDLTTVFLYHIHGTRSAAGFNIASDGTAMVADSKDPSCYQMNADAVMQFSGVRL
jgi:hypothetical protein